MLFLLVSLWGSHLHYGVDQKVVKYSLKGGVVSIQSCRGTHS